MSVQVAAISIIDDFLAEFPSGEALLLVTAVLLLLGYVAMRLSTRLRIPVVTIFVIVGVVIGPSALGLLSQGLVGSLDFVEPIALGFITFSAGEHLLLSELRRLPGDRRAAVALETVLPVVLVGIVTYVVTGSMAMAICLGAIAGTTGIATILATLRESGATGDLSRLLSVAMATDNLFAIVVFSLALPALTALGGTGSALSMYGRAVGGILLAVALGAAAALFLARFVGRVRSSSELFVLVLSLLLTAVAIGDFLEWSVLLIGLAMGTVTANRVGAARERERVFSSLEPFEGPLLALFFIWAGATLQVDALGSVGAAAVGYVVLRSLGKVAGPCLVAWMPWGATSDRRTVRLLGPALLPQGGPAIGLAVLAGQALPVLGDEILTVVLAAVVLFEITGPLAVRLSVRSAGETTEPAADRPLTLTEAIRVLDERTGQVVAVVDDETDAWEAVRLFDLAGRLGTRLLVVAIDEPVTARAEGSGSDRSLRRRPAGSLAARGDDVATVLERHLAGLDLEAVGLQAAVIRHACVEPLDGLVDVARAAGPDLLILAWGRTDHRAVSARLVDLAPCPVVEFPVAHPAVGLREPPSNRRASRRATRLGGWLADAIRSGRARTGGVRGRGR